MQWVFFAVFLLSCVAAALYPFARFLPLLILGIELIAFVVPNYLIFPFYVKRHYQKHKKILDVEITLTQTAKGLTLSSENGIAHLNWDKIFRWRHNKHIILIYLTSRICYIIPKRLNTLGLDSKQLIETLQQHVGNAF